MYSTCQVFGHYTNQCCIIFRISPEHRHRACSSTVALLVGNPLLKPQHPQIDVGMLESKCVTCVDMAPWDGTGSRARPIPRQQPGIDHGQVATDSATAADCDATSRRRLFGVRGVPPAAPERALHLPPCLCSGAGSCPAAVSTPLRRRCVRCSCFRMSLPRHKGRGDRDPG